MEKTGVSPSTSSGIPQSSVLAGQTCKRFVDNFDSVEEAQASYPSAELGYRDAHNHFDHLPDESDY